jgi:hypothetical protein
MADFDVPQDILLLKGFGISFESMIPETFEMELQQVSLVHLPQAETICSIHQRAVFFTKDFYKSRLDEGAASPARSRESYKEQKNKEDQEDQGETKGPNNVEK